MCCKLLVVGEVLPTAETIERKRMDSRDVFSAKFPASVPAVKLMLENMSDLLDAVDR